MNDLTSRHINYILRGSISISFLFLIRPIIRPTFINCTSDFLKYETHKQFINKKCRYKCIPESVGYHFYYPILLQRFSYSSFLKPPGPFLGESRSHTSLRDFHKLVKARIFSHYRKNHKYTETHHVPLVAYNPL